MGALLSLPLLVVPSMGTVRLPSLPQTLCSNVDPFRFLGLWQAAVVPLLALQYAVLVGNAATGKLRLHLENRKA